jgi:hypothetical protein
LKLKNALLHVGRGGGGGNDHVEKKNEEKNEEEKRRRKRRRKTKLTASMLCDQIIHNVATQFQGRMRTHGKEQAFRVMARHARPGQPCGSHELMMLLTSLYNGADTMTGLLGDAADMAVYKQRYEEERERASSQQDAADDLVETIHVVVDELIDQVESMCAVDEPSICKGSKRKAPVPVPARARKAPKEDDVEDDPAWAKFLTIFDDGVLMDKYGLRPKTAARYAKAFKTVIAMQWPCTVAEFVEQLRTDDFTEEQRAVGPDGNSAAKGQKALNKLKKIHDDDSSLFSIYYVAASL